MSAPPPGTNYAYRPPPYFAEPPPPPVRTPLEIPPKNPPNLTFKNPPGTYPPPSGGLGLASRFNAGLAGALIGWELGGQLLENFGQPQDLTSEKQEQDAIRDAIRQREQQNNPGEEFSIGPPPPFSGGQTPNILYRVFYKGDYWAYGDKSGEFDGTTICTGPVKKARVEFLPQNVQAIIEDGDAPNYMKYLNVCYR